MRRLRSALPAVVLSAALLAPACEAPPRIKDSEIDASALGRGLPRDFLLGTATAAHQVEGGNTHNQWWEWENSSYPDGTPHIRNGDTSLVATRSWERFEQDDLPLMTELGANAYRLSVEWSRLEPAPGQWDDQAAARYLEWLTALRARGIEPMVTLFHFTLPQWFVALGGFEKRENLPLFARFVRHAAETFGGQVDLWCTLNEPNVYAAEGYIEGIWPPGRTNSKLGAEVLANLLEAHALATAELRAHDTVDADGDGKATLIGIAHHVRVFQPASPSSLDGAVASLTDDFFNESVVQAVATGHIHLSVPGTVTIDRDVAGLKGSFDYLGLNYYTRAFVRADLGSPSLSNQYVPAGEPTNDLGWDIYPEGLYQFLVRFSHYGWPIYVTENGIADASGENRSAYLRTHLYAVERAIADGVDVRGYFHWSLLDNFEWADGYEPRFGLYTVDRSNPELPRLKTPAVDVFRSVACNLGHPVPDMGRSCP